MEDTATSGGNGMGSETLAAVAGRDPRADRDPGRDLDPARELQPRDDRRPTGERRPTDELQPTGGSDTSREPGASLDPEAARIDRGGRPEPEAAFPGVYELRTGARHSLDTVVRVAGRLFDVPVAFLAVREEGTTRIRAHVGIPDDASSRLEDLAELILERVPALLVVTDGPEAAAPETVEIAERLRALDFRACLAHPLSANGETAHGVLVLLARDHRELGPEERETLEALSTWARRELVLMGWVQGSVTLARRLEQLRRYARKVVEATDARELFPTPPPAPAARSAEGSLQDLTPRQREVLQLIARGNTSKEIGARLGISVKTVETHRRDLMNRLDIHDIAGLVRFAISVGLVRAEV